MNDPNISQKKEKCDESRPIIEFHDAVSGRRLVSLTIYSQPTYDQRTFFRSSFHRNYTKETFLLITNVFALTRFQS